MQREHGVMLWGAVKPRCSTCPVEVVRGSCGPTSLLLRPGTTASLCPRVRTTVFDVSGVDMAVAPRSLLFRPETTASLYILVRTTVLYAFGVDMVVASFSPRLRRINHGLTLPSRAHHFCAQTDPLSKVFNKFCEKLGVAESLVRLEFDGEALNLNSTAEDLEMEDGELIDATIHW